MRCCRHQWAERARTFTPSRPGSFEVRGEPGYGLKVTYGITNVELRCEDCGDMKFVTVAGKADRGA